MQWIIAKSVDDLVKSHSIDVRDFSNVEVLEAKKASALKKAISN